jgi:hypothetical protein
MALTQALTSLSPYSTVKVEQQDQQLFFSKDGVLRVEVCAAFYRASRMVLAV